MRYSLTTVSPSVSRFKSASHTGFRCTGSPGAWPFPDASCPFPFSFPFPGTACPLPAAPTAAALPVSDARCVSPFELRSPVAASRGLGTGGTPPSTGGAMVEVPWRMAARPWAVNTKHECRPIVSSPTGRNTLSLTPLPTSSSACSTQPRQINRRKSAFVSPALCKSSSTTAKSHGERPSAAAKSAAFTSKSAAAVYSRGQPTSAVVAICHNPYGGEITAIHPKDPEGVTTAETGESSILFQNTKRLTPSSPGASGACRSFQINRRSNLPNSAPPTRNLLHVQVFNSVPASMPPPIFPNLVVAPSVPQLAFVISTPSANPPALRDHA